MTHQHDAALAVAKSYFAKWNDGDFDALRGMLADDAVIVLPLSGGSSPDPSFVFTGKDGALGYLKFARNIFTGITFSDENWFVSEDAASVHLHARGDMRTKDGRPYRNVYVFRLEIRDGKIVHVDEYTNPIIWNDLGVS